VQAAVNLYQRFTLPEGPVITALDVADGGGAESALTARCGPRISLIGIRKEGDTTETARWAVRESESLGATCFFYDNVGVGSGVTAALGHTDGLTLPYHGINTGSVPSYNVWESDERTSNEIFANLKAEIWWLVRARFEKTYQHVVLGHLHALEDLISIPDDPTLITQLSSVKYETNDAGKIRIESKIHLRERGIASPDRAESLVLLFTPMLHMEQIRTRIFRPRLAADNYYTDAQRPDQLQFSADRSIPCAYGTAAAACVFLDIFDDGETIWVDNEYYHLGSERGEQKSDDEYVLEYKRFQGDDNRCQGTCYCDPEAEAFQRALRAADIAVWTTKFDLIPGIRYAQSLLERREIRICAERCPRLVQELNEYAWDDNAAKLGIEKPMKGDDYAIKALLYFIQSGLAKWRLTK
jgi:hypothetical protein